MFARNLPQWQSHTQNESGRIENGIPNKENQKQAVIAVLVSDTAESKPKLDQKRKFTT
jgi:hypothetical protein